MRVLVLVVNISFLYLQHPATAQSPDIPRFNGKSVDQLIVLLKDKDAGVRSEAASELFRHYSEARKAVPALIGALTDPDKDVRVAVADSLGAMGSKAKRAGPALICALKDRAPEVRSSVVRALVPHHSNSIA